VPEPGNPQSLNRYTYGCNNPVKYVDPDGHDPIDSGWESDFEQAHGHQPTDEDRQARLYSLMFRGSVSHSTNWTAEDWQAFNEQGPSEVFRGTAGRESLSDFADAVDTLSGDYEWNEQGQFVSAIALIFAGVDYHPDDYGAFWHTATSPQPVQHPYVNFGMAGWNPAYVEKTAGGLPIENTHHFAGHLLTGYMIGIANSPLTVAREVRSARRDGTNIDIPDVLLGNVAGVMGWMMRFYPPQFLSFGIRLDLRDPF
jgi:hypothetical protein